MNPEIRELPPEMYMAVARRWCDTLRRRQERRKAWRKVVVEAWLWMLILGPIAFALYVLMASGAGQ